MSKALRVSEEIALQPNFFKLVNWNPLYLESTGNNAPCYEEFMKLMECVNDKPIQQCYPLYVKLITCLKAHGIDDDGKRDV